MAGAVPDGLAEVMSRYAEWAGRSSLREADPFEYGPLKTFRADGRRMVANEAPTLDAERSRSITGWTLSGWIDGDPVIDVAGESNIEATVGGRHRSAVTEGWSLRWHDDPARGWVIIDSRTQRRGWQSEHACGHPGSSWSHPVGWTVRPLWNFEAPHGGWMLLASLTNSSETSVRFTDLSGRPRTIGPGLEVVLGSSPRADPSEPVQFSLSPLGLLKRHRKVVLATTLPPGHPKRGWCEPRH